MSLIKIQIKGLDQVKAMIQKHQENIEAKLGKIVEATALDVTRDVKKAIKGPPKTGHIYYRIPGEKYMTVRRGGKKGPIVAVFKMEGKANLSLRHKASAPGEAPASDTGQLANSIAYVMEDKLSARVHSPLKYAEYLEFGTRKIAPRPSWVPAIIKNMPKLEGRLQKLMAKRGEPQNEV